MRYTKKKLEKMNKIRPVLAWVIGAALIGGGALLLGGDEPSPFRAESESSYERFDNPIEERAYLENSEVDYDCPDFGSQEEAQEFFEEQGGPSKDPHNLDRDGDG